MFGSIDRHAYRLTRPLVLLPMWMVVTWLRRDGFTIHRADAETWHAFDSADERQSGATEAIASVWPMLFWLIPLTYLSHVLDALAGGSPDIARYAVVGGILACSLVLVGSIHALSSRPMRVNPPEEVRHDA